MNCDEVRLKELVEKYILNRMDENERDAFEKHFFECEKCFQEVQAFRALQTELSLSREKILAEPVAQKGFSWNFAWAGAAAIVIVLIGAIWFIYHPFFKPVPAQPEMAQTAPEAPASGEPKVSTPEIPGTTAPAAIKPPLRILEDWIRVTAPSYAPIKLRGLEDESRKLFHQAMEKYIAKDYSAAIPGLEEAAKLEPNAADIHFFLAASYLLTEQDERAIDEFKVTIDLGDTPFLEESHFYLAKAYYGAGNTTAATKEMKEVMQLQGNLEGEARRLLDQIPSEK